MGGFVFTVHILSMGREFSADAASTTAAFGTFGTFQNPKPRSHTQPHLLTSPTTP